MSSSRVIPIAVATSPILVWLPFSAHSTGSDVPQELYAQKNSCGGFKLGIPTGSVGDLSQVQLLSLTFGSPDKDNACIQSQGKKDETTDANTISGINDQCKNHQFTKDHWPELKNEKSQKLASFGECLKLIKEMIPIAKTKLKNFSIIGEII